MTASATDVDSAIARMSIDEHAVQHALALLLSRPSPPGEERELAEAIAAWGQKTHADLSWKTGALDDRSANLFARSALGTGALPGREVNRIGRVRTERRARTTPSKASRAAHIGIAVFAQGRTMSASTMSVSSGWGTAELGGPSCSRKMRSPGQRSTASMAARS